MIAQCLLMGTLVSACSDYNDYQIRVQIKNDLTMSVKIKQCGDSCASIEDTQDLMPGQSTEVTASRGAGNPWLVQASSGSIVGCLPLDFADGFTSRNATVRVSQMVSARLCH